MVVLSKYHVNKKGEPGVCRATKFCPFGGESEHYATRKEAAKAFESAMSSFTIPERKVLSLSERVMKLDEELNKARESGVKMSGLALGRRRKTVEELVDKLVKAGKTTDKTHAKEVLGSLVFIEERARKHDEIVSEFLSSVESVPRGGKVLFAGGLGGAGKSTVLGKYANIDKSDYATLNPDDVKEIMATKGLIPKVRGLTAMEASPLVHEEASHITKRLMAELAEQRVNICFDITMSSLGSVESKVGFLKSAGYGKVEAIFVDIEPETSLERSRGRYVEGINDYVEGKNDVGGRVLPEHVVKDQAPTRSGFRSKNAETLVDAFNGNLFTSRPRIFDNNSYGIPPREIAFDDFVGDFSDLMDS